MYSAPNDALTEIVDIRGGPYHSGVEPVLLRAVRFFAVILTALALVPAGAHFFELPKKIRLSQEQYTVRGIDRGWALFGIVLLGAIGANLGTRDPEPGRATCFLVRTSGLHRRRR
jgi:hypothetical protein